MTRKLIQRVLAISLLAAVAAAFVFAQDYQALVGKWNMTSETNGDPVSWILILKDSGGKLTASLATDGGEVPAKDFTFSGGVLKFKAPYQGEDYDIELKAAADKLDGTWNGNGDSGRTSGIKSMTKTE